MANSRRRKTPIPRASGTWERKRRPVRSRAPADWTDVLIKFFIGLFIVFDLVLILFIIRQCSKPPVPEGAVAPVEERERILQLEVLNGCGVSGVANRFTEYLRDKGFDVLRTDNYESFTMTRTIVINRTEDHANAVRVAQALGLDEKDILVELNYELLIDASVIIGRDYRQLEVWKEMER